MKVLVISNLYPPYFNGGYELQCRDVTEALAERGHHMIVVASMHGVNSAQIDGNVHRVLRYINDEITPDMYANKIRNLRQYIKAQTRIASISRHNAKIIKQTINKVCPDVVYAWNLDGLTISPLISAYECRIPLLCRLGDTSLIGVIEYYNTRNRIRKWVRRVLTGVNEPHLLLNQSYYLPNSNYLRDRYIEVGIDQNKIFTLNLGVRIPKSIPVFQNSTTFRMLYTGRICKEKGVDVAIKAIKLLSTEPGIKPFTLDIIGSGPDDYIEQMKNLVDSSGLGEQVRFLGKIPKDELDTIRANYHAFIFPAVWDEPFGRVLIEAMAYGVPIIASPVGGTAEYLENGKNALTFPPGDYTALASLIKQLMNNPTLMQVLREGGRKTAQERFEFERFIDSHEQYLLLAYNHRDMKLSIDGGSLGKS